MAGLKAVNESVKNPLLYWDFNLAGTISLLKVMREYSCKNLIFSSSATIYSRSNKQIKENFKIQPINPYGETKLKAEEYITCLLYTSDAADEEDV